MTGAESVPSAKWQDLFQYAASSSRALDNLAEHATAALFASGNALAVKAVAGHNGVDLSYLCSVLDAHSVPVPDQIARLVEAASKW